MIHTNPVFQILLAAALAMGLACSEPPAPPDLPNPADFRTGMTRDEVVESFGSPARMQSFTKSGGPMWGAIEDFWFKLPTGAGVELWAYPSVGGTMELYFVDESKHVVGMGFAPEGVAPVVIDVRTPAEYASGHVPGAVNIPLDEVAQRIAEVEAPNGVALYCMVGPRARKGESALLAAGYASVFHLEGGLAAWESAGLPVERAP